MENVFAYIIVTVIFSPLVIFIFGSELYLIYLIVSKIATMEDEELKCQMRKNELEQRMDKLFSNQIELSIELLRKLPSDNNEPDKTP